MHVLMEQLKTDHRNVALMMRTLERQLDIVQGMGNADFELMHDIMLYMTHYPDLIHHPLEDLMFDRMGDLDAQTSATVATLRREHAGLLDKGLHFLERLRLVVDGSMVERTEIEALGRDYVAFMRHHMTLEDTEIFPRAEQALSDADWEAIAGAIESLADPVFGPIVDEQYRTLLDHIRQQTF